jgi:hypothetical protein
VKKVISISEIVAPVQIEDDLCEVWPSAEANYHEGLKVVSGVTLISGFRRELENLVDDAKGKGPSGRPARPKVPRRSWRGRVMPVEPRGWVTRVENGLVNWQQEEPAGFDRKGDTSRIRREAYVRF